MFIILAHKSLAIGTQPTRRDQVVQSHHVPGGREELGTCEQYWMTVTVSTLGTEELYVAGESTDTMIDFG